ncbi:MAG: protein phosphatase CheZ [Deltaproteobacteria bacterium]|nr:protein phosphatase CheZ [Deltaproteobacteria bacterium]MBW2118808.1 protein phosphatase CheZ [Deltaproteobacteria bacterium]
MKKNFKKEINNIVEGKLSSNEIEQLTVCIKQAMTNGMDHNDDGFFKNLASEMTGSVKELAMVLIDFRRELKSKIHPNLTDIATKYIPQAADQLEGVIETTEMATNKVMDNLENMEQNIGGIKKVLASLREGTIVVPGHERINHEVKIDKKTVKNISPVIDYMESSTEDYVSLITDSFTQMSFQDLTGQRIKRIINLVSEMEERIKGMVISFGIKLNEREKNPGISQDELQKVVDEKVEELSGPQRQGQGLDQAGIDDLLANL